MHYFLQTVVGFRGLISPQTLTAGPRWGTFVPRSSLIYAPLEKNPAGDHANSKRITNKHFLPTYVIHTAVHVVSSCFFVQKSTFICRGKIRKKTVATRATLFWLRYAPTCLFPSLQTSLGELQRSPHPLAGSGVGSTPPPRKGKK